MDSLLLIVVFYGGYYSSYYIIDGIAYIAYSLDRITWPGENPLEQESIDDSSLRFSPNTNHYRQVLCRGRIIYHISLYIRNLTSNPVIVYTENGWVITSTVNLNYKIISYSSREALIEPTSEVDRLIIPDVSGDMSVMISGDMSGNLPTVLEESSLPRYNDSLLREITVVVDNRKRLSTILGSNSNFNSLIPSRSDQEEITRNNGLNEARMEQQVRENIEPTDLLFKQSYETLLKQLYGTERTLGQNLSGSVQLPEYLIINGLRANFVSVQRIGEMLSQNQIERHIIDPLLQTWAGPPGTSYRIFTFLGKNGVSYLVRARYNAQTNQIFS